MKTEVYSWRISSGLKSDLERVARRRKVKVSAVLETAVRDWMAKNAADTADAEEQVRLHVAADRILGAFASGNRHGSTTVRQTIRKRLANKHAR